MVFFIACSANERRNENEKKGKIAFEWQKSIYVWSVEIMHQQPAIKDGTFDMKLISQCHSELCT